MQQSQTQQPKSESQHTISTTPKSCLVSNNSKTDSKSSLMIQDPTNQLQQQKPKQQPCLPLQLEQTMSNANIWVIYNTIKPSLSTETKPRSPLEAQQICPGEVSMFKTTMPLFF